MILVTGCVGTGGSKATGSSWTSGITEYGRELVIWLVVIFWAWDKDAKSKYDCFEFPLSRLLPVSNVNEVGTFIVEIIPFCKS